MFIRDSTCSFCEKCLNGDVLNCTQIHRNGTFKNFVISKAKKPISKKRSIVQEESSESDSKEEFVYCSDSSSEGEDFTDEEDEETPDVLDCSPGRYVLFRLTKNKYYVSSVLEVEENQVILKAARKYGDHQGKITFCWPTIDDIYPVIGGLHPENSTGLPDPVIDRRGSTLTFRQCDL